MTHDNLVKRAVRWLKNSRRCQVVMAERATMYAIEIPDAIGFRSPTGTSILIECKATKEDYYSDGSKSFRKNPDTGMGDERYYLTVKGLLHPDKIRENWGLLEICGKQIRKKRDSGKFKADKNAEIVMLISQARQGEI